MWQLTAAANGAIVVAYSLVAAAILRPLVRTRRVRANLLGTATAAVFLTGAVHHGAHLVHPRTAFGRPAAAWDVLSAAVAVYCWTLRRSYGALLLRADRGALETDDDVVQGLALAQYRYETGDHEQAHAAVVATLAAARRMTRGMAVEPGDLVRTAPARVPPPGT